MRGIGINVSPVVGRVTKDLAPLAAVSSVTGPFLNLVTVGKSAYSVLATRALANLEFAAAIDAKFRSRIGHSPGNVQRGRLQQKQQNEDTLHDCFCRPCGPEARSENLEHLLVRFPLCTVFPGWVLRRNTLFLLDQLERRPG